MAFPTGKAVIGGFFAKFGGSPDFLYILDRPKE
jgi:hypothetical protein